MTYKITGWLEFSDEDKEWEPIQETFSLKTPLTPKELELRTLALSDRASKRYNFRANCKRFTAWKLDEGLWIRVPTGMQGNLGRFIKEETIMKNNRPRAKKPRQDDINKYGRKDKWSMGWWPNDNMGQ